MRQEQLAGLREYAANPWVKYLNAKAIRDKNRDRKKHLTIPAIRWPQQVVIGEVISWEVYQQGPNCSKGRWATREGKVVSVNHWHIAVDTGKYVDTVLLKDLFIGLVRMEVANNAAN